jgi:radical SAM superfamily enzyme YgiQ (UPF0313 family)
MLTLVNTNRMTPPIAPIGLDYVAAAARQAGIEVELLDLGLAADPEHTTRQYFQQRKPRLVGLTFRNVDDCFWPSAQTFVPILQRDVVTVRQYTDAPIVVGGVGYSIFPQRLLECSEADFGIWGDGEQSLVGLYHELTANRGWQRVPGLVYRDKGGVRINPAAWPRQLDTVSHRDLVDNRQYFARGGQMGIETKRGCPRQCIYCVDPLAKGKTHRLRGPSHVGEEIEALLAQEIDVLHICDPEFNLPITHALDVCREMIRRGLGGRLRWYAYLAVQPFTAELATLMARAGCVGINFTSDSAVPRILKTYRHGHRIEHLQEAVNTCRANGISVMLDMLLGGPGETPESVAETVAAFRQLDPDCAGAALGVRVYPGTAMAALVESEGDVNSNSNLCRHYAGPIDLLQPTFYISSALGNRPAEFVRELIGDDPRFFPPSLPRQAQSSHDHNYNDNQPLADAIAAGQRGAYWDILRRTHN